MRVGERLRRRRKNERSECAELRVETKCVGGVAHALGGAPTRAREYSVRPSVTRGRQGCPSSTSAQNVRREVHVPRGAVTHKMSQTTPLPCFHINVHKFGKVITWQNASHTRKNNVGLCVRRRAVGYKKRAGRRHNVCGRGRKA